MAKAVYICPDTRALAVRDRALVVGTVKSDPGCICGVTGCCGGGAEPCTLPAEDGPGGTLTIAGSASLTIDVDDLNCATTPQDSLVTFTGGTAPLTATACECLSTSNSGQPTVPFAKGHVVQTTDEFNPFPGSGYSRVSQVAVESIRAGSAPMGACGDDNNLWTLRFQYYQGLRKWNSAVCGGLDYVLTLEARIKVKMDPNKSPCIVERTVFARTVATDNNLQPPGFLQSQDINDTVELPEAIVSITRDGACGIAIRVSGSSQVTYPGSGSPLTVRTAFDLTFTDGAAGCSHANLPSSCLGACCTNGVCSQKSLIDCEAGGGAFYGQGVPCAPLICAPVGPIPTCCDTSCCRVTSLAPGGNLLINWTLRMESQGRACCTNFNPAQVRLCAPVNTNNSGVATTPYTSDCMTFTEGQVQGQKTLSPILAVNPTCCPGTTVNNIFINPNQVGFIASCNATSGPLFTFVIRLSHPGGAVVSFVSQSCNSISFDETVSVFQQSCGAGTLFWLADIRMIGSATITNRFSCTSPAFGNRPDDDFIARPSIENSRDVLFHGSNVPLRKLARGGCGTCGGKSTGGLKGLSK